MTKAEKEELFNEWWEMFDKKVGKKKVLVKWHNLAIRDFPTIFGHTPEYVRSTPNKQYRMNPLTYLNGEHWEDEIVFKTKSRSNMDRETIGKLQKYG